MAPRHDGGESRDVPPLPVWFLALGLVGGVLALLFVLAVSGVDVAAWLA